MPNTSSGRTTRYHATNCHARLRVHCDSNSATDCFDTSIIGKVMSGLHRGLAALIDFERVAIRRLCREFRRGAAGGERSARTNSTIGTDPEGALAALHQYSR